MKNLQTEEARLLAWLRGPIKLSRWGLALVALVAFVAGAVLL